MGALCATGLEDDRRGEVFKCIIKYYLLIKNQIGLNQYKSKQKETYCIIYMITCFLSLVLMTVEYYLLLK